MDQSLLESLRQVALPLLTNRGIELVDLLCNRSNGRVFLRFLVDRPGGITLDECAQLNREIGQLLDTQDLIQQRYLLEVSSPGLDRPLSSSKDFERCLGQSIKVDLHQPLHGQNVWVGRLEQVNEQEIIIQAQQQQALSIAHRDIARARLEVCC